MPRRPKRDRAKGKAASVPPGDDRFAPHPDQSIDVVYIIGRAAHLVGARLKVVVGVMLASLAVAAVSGFIVSAAGAGGFLTLDNVIVGMMVTWLLGLLLQTPLVGAAIEIHTERRGLALEFLRRGLARFGAIFAASLAVALIGAVIATVGVFFQLGLMKILDSLPLGFVNVILGFVGSVIILVICLRAITAFSLVVPIILIEDTAAGAALRRSWEIGWRNGSPIFLAVLLPALVANGVLFLASFMPAFIYIPVGIVLAILLALYNSAVVPSSYVIIREFNDGVDPAHLLRAPRRR